jgi:transposase
MKKHSYRVVGIQGFCVKKAVLAEVPGAATLTFAVDVAKTKMVGVFALGNQPLATLGWTQPAETGTLLAVVAEVRAAGHPVEVVMEPTGTYGDALRYQLQAQGVSVFLVSAKHVHDAAEIFDGVPSKHDAKDAAVIAWLHAQGKTHLWLPRSDLQATLRALLAELHLYRRALGPMKNQLEALFARHFPEALQLLDIQRQKTTWALFAQMPAPAQLAADPVATHTMLKSVSRNRMSQAKIDALLATSAASTGVPMCAAERQLVARLATQITAHDAAADTVVASITATLAALPAWHPLCALLGAVTTAVLLAHVGDPTQFSCAAAWQKAMGLNLRERSSGTHQGKLQLTKRGAGIARQYLYLAAMRLVMSSTIAQRWYTARTQHQNGCRKAALVAVMRKLAAATFHVGRGATFDITQLFDLRRLPADTLTTAPRKNGMSFVPDAAARHAAQATFAEEDLTDLT